MIVFLADLQNSYYRYLRNSVPIGMGYVYAYVDKVFGKDVEVHQFRKFEDMYETMATVTPDLVAFGSYSWNTSLTQRAANYLRERFPDVVIATGGPDISQNVPMAMRDLTGTPAYDFVMPNEGEGPVRALIEAYMARGSRKNLVGTAVAGCITIDPETGGPLGSVQARFEDDINAIPSPYLDGLMDSFLAEPDYLPIIQTSRGCPYRCTFCVSGKDTWSKVKAFDIDRVKAEIDYVAERAVNRYLRLADENFGILHRDVEIAEYIMKKRRDSGFPNAVSIYTDKHPTDRVKTINKLMKDCLPFCISFQSTTPDVLKAIKRINLKDQEVESAVEFARENELMLVTELIFPLPGETRESFFGSVDKLIDHRFESIAINHMRLLKGTEMDLPEDREKHKVVSKFLMSENGYTDHPALKNVEIDEAVIGNATLPEAQVHEVNKFVFLLDFSHNRSLHKELLFLFDCHGVRATDLLNRIAENPDQYPVLGERAARYAEGVKERMLDSPDEVRALVRHQMETAPDTPQGIGRVRDNLIIEILMNDQFDDTIREICGAGEAIYREQFGEVPQSLKDEIALVSTITRHAYIPVDRRVEAEVEITTPLDVGAWIRNNYRGALQGFRNGHDKTFRLRIPNIQPFENSWNNAKETRLNKFRKIFLTINSANRRRVIEPVQSGTPAAAE